MSKPEEKISFFSYVVEHDTGYAPNPDGEYCTLAGCKYSKTGKPGNIVELAKKGDWIIGTGGANEKKSSGFGTLLYAMEVTEILQLKKYCKDSRYNKRKDAKQLEGISVKHTAKHRMALISDNFYYFGQSAVKIPKQFEGLIKDGPKYKKFVDIETAPIKDFLKWVKRHKPGKRGEPCMHDKNENKCQKRTGVCK